MKIAILVRRLQPPGGAEKSALFLQEELQTKHSVQVFGLKKRDGNINNTSSSDVVAQIDPKTRSFLPNHIYTALFGEFRTALSLRSDVKKFNPDYIIAQHDMVFLAALIGKRQNIPYTILLHDESLLTDINGDYSGIIKKLLSLRSGIYSQIISQTLRQADYVIANSKYISHKYEVEFPNSRLHTVYPFIDADKYRVHNKGNKILHVNPREHKGIRITLGVADKLTNEEFIITGPSPTEGIKKRISQLENVNYMGYVDNMSDIYSQTKIVIYPSKWPEPFGRIPIEAGVSGIPTVCSGTGGLEEAIGNKDLIVTQQTPAAYAEKIERVFEEYDYYSNFVKKHAQRIAGDSQVNKFVDLIGL